MGPEPLRAGRCVSAAVLTMKPAVCLAACLTAAPKFEPGAWKNLSSHKTAGWRRSELAGRSGERCPTRLMFWHVQLAALDGFLEILAFYEKTTACVEAHRSLAASLK